MVRIARRLGRALIAAAVVSLVGTSTVLGAWKQGETNCPAWKRVTVYSRASVHVFHYWSGGWSYYYNPYREYREDRTGLSSTWWTIDYDFEITAWGGYCGSL